MIHSDMEMYRLKGLFRALLSAQEEKFWSLIGTLHTVTESRTDYEVPLLKQTFTKYLNDQCDENFEYLKEIVLHSPWGDEYISLSDEELREVFDFELWRSELIEWRENDE